MRAGNVRCESDFAQRGDCQVSRTPIGQPFIESVIDVPLLVGRVESQDLRSLPPFRSGSILPVSIARIEPAFVGSENADLGTSHEAARPVARPSQIGGLKSLLRTGVSAGERPCRAADDNNNVRYVEAQGKSLPTTG